MTNGIRNRKKRNSMNQADNMDQSIAAYPKDTQVILQKIRATVHEAAPNAEQAIAYGVPTFRLNGKNLVHFSVFARHIGFYPTSSAITKFKKEISQYKWAKGSVQFPLDKPIPYGLIKRIVAFRVREVEKKK